MSEDIQNNNEKQSSSDLVGRLFDSLEVPKKEPIKKIEEFPMLKAYEPFPFHIWKIIYINTTNEKERKYLTEAFNRRMQEGGVSNVMKQTKSYQEAII